jgi:RNA polymerase sigma-70 factor, ECF subfamily
MTPAVTSLAFAWWASGPDEPAGGRFHLRAGDSAGAGGAFTPEHPDSAIVAQIVAGDRDAFDAVYLSRYPMLHRLARQWCRSADAAEDLVQEIFVDLWIRRSAWTVRTSITAYLVGAIRNKLRRQFRDVATADRIANIWNSHALFPGTSQPLPLPTEVAEQNELVRAVARAVETLPPRQRIAALLHWHDGLTSGEIAEVMEISDRVARKLIAAGLVKLRASLHEAREHQS